MRVVLVTTCTARKSAKAGPAIELSALPEMDADRRARHWVEALRAANVEPFPVEHLYQGDHWQQSRRAIAVARDRGFKGELWVMSAGYGLVPVRPEVKLKPYDATFVTDSVQGYSTPETSSVNGVSGARRDPLRQTLNAQSWWHALTAASLLEHGDPATLEQLVGVHSEPTLFVILLAEIYLKSVRPDLDRAVRSLPKTSRLLILSAGASSRAMSGLEGFAPVFGGEFARVVGGSLGALNARTAAWVLERVNAAECSVEQVQRLISDALAGTPAREVVERREVQDAEIVATIVRYLRNEAVPITRLHRLFRDELRIRCSVKRFVRCYGEALAVVT